MNCWHCDRPAHAVCNFCGRAVCKEHVETLPGLITVFRDRDSRLRGVATANTIFCGVCEPQRRPIDLDGIDVDPSASDSAFAVDSDPDPETPEGS